MDNTILDTFQLTIYTREGMVFHEHVKGLTTINDVGPLSIISGHTNFISIITGDVTVVFGDNTEKQFPVSQGVLRHYDNRSEVYISLQGREEAVGNLLISLRASRFFVPGSLWSFLLMPVP